MFIMNRATQNLIKKSKKSKRREQTNMKKLSKTNVNNMKKGAVAVALVASLGLAGLSAYFTDTKNATNTFTVGSVKQEITEDKWDPEKGKDITPGKEVKKNPTVTNTGKNEQYVFIKLKVPAAEVTTVNDNGTKGNKEFQELFTYHINEGWKELNPIPAAQDNNSVTHVFYYSKGTDAKLTKLTKEASTPALFDKVKFINIVEDNGTLKGDQNIVIDSYGIQSDNLGDATTPDQVWKLVQNQTK